MKQPLPPPRTMRGRGFFFMEAAAHLRLRERFLTVIIIKQTLNCARGIYKSERYYGIIRIGCGQYGHLRESAARR